MSEIQGVEGRPPRGARKVRVGQLRTLGGLSAELARLYRQARRGEIAAADASRLASILAVARQCIEASDLERRLNELEASASGKVLLFCRRTG
jgi:hypothetical protein